MIFITLQSYSNISDVCKLKYSLILMATAWCYAHHSQCYCQLSICSYQW